MKALAALAFLLPSMPVAALAQAMPDHDRSSMPGMGRDSKPIAKRTVASQPKADHASAPPVLPTPGPDLSTKDHDVSAMPGMDHDAMQTPAEDPPDRPGTKPVDMTGSGKGAAADGMPMGAMPMGAMQGGAPPSDARDPDAYADGLELEHLPGMDMADDAKHLYVLIDRLEATRTHGEHGQSLDAQAWYGGDLDKLWIKVDGERGNGRLGATRTEALWNHAVATYWGLQTGVRQDFGNGPGRTWAAFGVQGLSPYWFDVQATAYVGRGRGAARCDSRRNTTCWSRSA